VNTSLVSLEIPPLGESFAATSAAVVLLSRVDLHVGVHVPLLSECLSADVASVWFVSRVDHHVRLEVPLLSEWSVADGAEELLDWSILGAT